MKIIKYPRAVLSCMLFATAVMSCSNSEHSGIINAMDSDSVVQSLDTKQLTPDRIVDVLFYACSIRDSIMVEVEKDKVGLSKINYAIPLTYSFEREEFVNGGILNGDSLSVFEQTAKEIGLIEYTDERAQYQIYYSDCTSRYRFMWCKGTYLNLGLDVPEDQRRFMNQGVFVIDKLLDKITYWTYNRSRTSRWYGFGNMTSVMLLDTSFSTVSQVRFDFSTGRNLNVFSISDLVYSGTNLESEKVRNVGRITMQIDTLNLSHFYNLLAGKTRYKEEQFYPFYSVTSPLWRLNGSYVFKQGKEGNVLIGW